MFEILKNPQFVKFAKFRMKTFFPRLAIPMTFWLYTVITLVILNTEFGLIWTTPWPDEKGLFLKFLFREIQKVLYENPTFFLVNLNKKKLFALHCHYTVDTPYRVWFNFGQLLNPMKKNYVWNSQKFEIREIRKIPYEKPFFS